MRHFPSIFAFMKILMVCLGNICRSPLAHGVLQHYAMQKGLPWEVDSAGTGDWHIGQAPDRRSVAVAQKYGIDISTQRAQWFEPHLFDRFDQIFVMDRNNLRDVLAQARNAADKAKVQLFLADGEVPDPYYDDNLFEPVYRLIADRCEEIVIRF